MARISLVDLLNPEPQGMQVDAPVTSLVDLQPALTALSHHISPLGPLLVPINIADSVSGIIQYLSATAPSSASGSALSNPPRSSNSLSVNASELPPLEFNVQLNRSTRLNRLHRYEVGKMLEYPETHADGVGHLFTMDPENWNDPWSSFAYSLGTPCGGSTKSTTVFCELLKDTAGNRVACREYHYTCMFLVVREQSMC